MAGKKTTPKMPSNIPNLLLISGDIINPVKLLMDTAGQVVGKNSQEGPGNTKKERQNERTEAKSHSSKHTKKTTKQSKERENKDQGGKTKGKTNKQKNKKVEEFSTIDNFENKGYSGQKEARKLLSKSHQNGPKPTYIEKVQIPTPEISR